MESKEESQSDQASASSAPEAARANSEETERPGARKAPGQQAPEGSRRRDADGPSDPARERKSSAEEAWDRSRAFAEKAAGRLRPLVAGVGGHAAGALATVAADPVAGVPRAREALSTRDALGVSLVFAVGAALCIAVGVHLVLGSVLGFVYSASFGVVVQLLGASLVSVAVLAALCFAARRLFGQAGNYGDDAFLAATALVPMALAIFLIGLLGIGNYLIASALGVFALSYVVLILHAGFRHLAEVPERRAAPLVPAVLVLSVWLAQVLFGAVA